MANNINRNINPNNYRLPRNRLRYPRAGRIRYITQAGYRNRNIKKNNRTIEINKAVGGIKPVILSGPVRRLTVDSYVEIVVNSQEDTFVDSSYYWRNNYLNFTTLDLVSLLNQDNEFINWRAYSSAFKITAVNISFNYTRIPHSGEFFPKIMLSPETDVVDLMYQPLQEHNNMIWDMSSLGVKNYTIKIRRNNTYTQDLGWQNAANGYSGTLKVTIGSQLKDAYVYGQTNLGRETLGVVHVSIKCTMKLNDSERPINKRGENNPVPTKLIRLAQDQIVKEKALQMFPEIAGPHEEIKQKEPEKDEKEETGNIENKILEDQPSTDNEDEIM
jgi:hypothetical protein